jgi:D-3-phosphoglycerate dehydrogenase
VNTPELEANPLSYPKHKIRVLLLEGIHESARRMFENDGVHVELLPSALEEKDLIEAIRDVHLVGIRSKTQVTAAVIESARRLLSVGCFCIGTNQVDLDACNARGIPVFNAPFSNTRSVAELIISEVVALSRQLGDRNREMHEGNWQKSAKGSREVRGKTLGIVGYGRIGRQVGVLAEAMGMQVVSFDVVSQLPMGNNRPLGSLDALLEISDFVTLHVPASPETRNMMAAPQLARMKQGACLLNLSRGSVVDIEALAAALENHLGGAAIDVFPVEPRGNGPGFESALRGLKNVILTPHVGGSTLEAQEAIGREVATSLLKFLNGGASNGAVNFPQVDPPILSGRHRILNVHRNVPGVLSNINRIISDLQANVESQFLSTDPRVGYLVMDLDRDVSEEVKTKIAELDTSISTRILY